MNHSELEQLARQIMAGHHDPKLGAPGPGTRAWEEAVEPIVATLRQHLDSAGPEAVRRFACEHHARFRLSLAASLRQIDLDLRRGGLSPAQHVADHVLVRAYRPSADMPLPGSFAFESVRQRLTGIIEERQRNGGGVAVMIDDVMVDSIRRLLLDAHEDARRDVVRAAEAAASQ